MFRFLYLIIFLLLHTYSVEAFAKPLPKGTSVPDMQFVDIDGRRGQTVQDAHTLTVISFAGRYSAERLEKTIEGIDIKLMKSYPDAQLTYINFADVMSVPGPFRGFVKGVIRFLNNRLKGNMKKKYAKHKVKKAAEKTVFQLTPDWDGRYHQAFGLENADKFTCMVAYQGKIIGYLVEGTENFASKYHQLIEQTLQQEGS